jgi:hypothetical protein
VRGCATVYCAKNIAKRAPPLAGAKPGLLSTGALGTRARAARDMHGKNRRKLDYKQYNTGYKRITNNYNYSNYAGDSLAILFFYRVGRLVHSASRS